MDLGVVGRAVGLFAVTNVDDIVVLALFFAQGAGVRGAGRRILVGQYGGFAGILVVAVGAAFGVGFLPGAVVPYLGLLPVALGVKSAVQAWKHRRDSDSERAVGDDGPRALVVAAVTFANGGDNIGVYVPVFATAGGGGVVVYVAVFLVLVGVWVVAGRYFATRAGVAEVLSRWGHVVLPVVLIGVGVLILVEGGAFGL